MNRYTLRVLTPSSTAARITQPPQFSRALRISLLASSWSWRQAHPIPVERLGTYLK